MNNHSKPTTEGASEDDTVAEEIPVLSKTEALAMLQRLFVVAEILAKAQVTAVEP